MTLRLLLLVTAIAEGATGAALLLAPNVPVWILFGQSLDSALALLIGRVAGAALLALGIACWRAADDAQSPAAVGLVVSLLIYDLIAAALLFYAWFGLEQSGVGLWVAIVAHLLLALWCIAGLREGRFGTVGENGT